MHYAQILSHYDSHIWISEELCQESSSIDLIQEVIVDIPQGTNERIFAVHIVTVMEA